MSTSPPRGVGSRGGPVRTINRAFCRRQQYLAPSAPIGPHHPPVAACRKRLRPAVHAAPARLNRRHLHATPNARRPPSNVRHPVLPAAPLPATLHSRPLHTCPLHVPSSRCTIPVEQLPPMPPTRYTLPTACHLPPAANASRTPFAVCLPRTHHADRNTHLSAASTASSTRAAPLRHAHGAYPRITAFGLLLVATVAATRAQRLLHTSRILPRSTTSRDPHTPDVVCAVDSFLQHSSAVTQSLSLPSPPQASEVVRSLNRWRCRELFWPTRVYPTPRKPNKTPQIYNVVRLSNVCRRRNRTLFAIIFCAFPKDSPTEVCDIVGCHTAAVAVVHFFPRPILYLILTRFRRRPFRTNIHLSQKSAPLESASFSHPYDVCGVVVVVASTPLWAFFAPIRACFKHESFFVGMFSTTSFRGLRLRGSRTVVIVVVVAPLRPNAGILQHHEVMRCFPKSFFG
ncbi:hypothetical protein GGX14DRAFT_574787 [Mycena pura]|uniref:Uncharacterized protein n=1 Tax=Mycena pura TaxID=153505 RepID=A0AAD6UXE6_9AGAR|nr:hypothetical protein GGX14DRAFT_574787 [Mycena pura]